MKKSEALTIAVAKGYLLSEAVALLRKAGVSFAEDLSDSRKLFTFDSKGKIRLLQVRPWDVTEYVEQGAADLGVVGKDVLAEKQNRVMTLLDLKFGQCKLVLAGPDKKMELPYNVRVATKYPNCAERYFHDLGLGARIIKLYGAIELAPLTGLSDVIVDLTATGNTLKEHKLHVLDTLVSSTAHLIANPIGLKFRYADIVSLTSALSGALKQ